jgi:hypothetical protein
VTRVSVEDLLGAADWLRAYEGPDGPIGEHGACGDERAVELLRVAEWLDAEVTRRHRESQVRTVARAAAERAGRKPNDPAVVAAARRALARHADEQATP